MKLTLKKSKVNFMVLLDRDTYVNHMDNILKNQTKFKKAKRENRKKKTRTLNFHVNHDKCFNEYFKSLKSSCHLSASQYQKIKAVGSRPGILHGLCEIYKTIVFCHLLDPYFYQENCPSILLEI